MSKKRLVPAPTHEFNLKAALECIQGVQSAAVAFDSQGNISEVHLVASASRSAKSLVRDTESVLFAQFGIQIDYRKISIAQVANNDRQPLSRRQLRLAAATVNGGESDPPFSAHIVLRTDDGSFQALVPIQTDTPEAEAFAAGAATLVAAQDALGVVFPLSLRDMRIVAADGNQVCLAVVHAKSSYGVEYLTGSCVVGQSVPEAASKATLDAINRRLGFWARLR